MKPRSRYQWIQVLVDVEIQLHFLNCKNVLRRDRPYNALSLIMHCKRMPLAVRNGVPRIPIVKAVVTVVRISYPAWNPGFPDRSGNVFRH
jgi:hypothetical protein